MPKAIQLFLLCIIFVFSGCKNQKIAENKKYTKKNSAIDEARLVDIPFPLHSVPEGLALIDSAQSGITYKTKFSKENLLSFYRAEMERLGWAELTVFEQQHELLMVFDKPYKICVVSFCADTIKIFMGTKT